MTMRYINLLFTYLLIYKPQSVSRLSRLSWVYSGNVEKSRNRRRKIYKFQNNWNCPPAIFWRTRDVRHISTVMRYLKTQLFHSSYDDSITAFL